MLKTKEKKRKIIKIIMKRQDDAPLIIMQTIQLLAFSTKAACLSVDDTLLPELFNLLTNVEQAALLNHTPGSLKDYLIKNIRLKNKTRDYLQILVYRDITK